MNPPISPERVLPTLNADGTRNRIRPRLYPGRIHRRRHVAAWGLMALFIALPLLKIGGKPALFLDVIERQFTFFGHTFLATDGVLLMLLMLTIFASVFWLTALVGRAWCGWACPQTVYMEFLFRPVERLFEGKREAQLRLDQGGLSLRRVAKNVVFLVLAFALANVFLSYFVGVHALRTWITESPSRHTGGFLVVAVTTGLMFFDFAYFREQMCTVICPYARLQSVLLDRRSLLIGYDVKRGEPRSKGKPKPNHGDCIDCQACVASCPTGIDIRQGLQLECIACGQCADACDSIMDRIHKPHGLIGYASQEQLESGRAPSMLRTRTVIYSALLVGLIATLTIAVSTKQSADVTILRGVGAPFSESGSNIVNQLRVKVQNRSGQAQSYHLELEDFPNARLIAPEDPLLIAAGDQRTTTVFVLAPKDAFRHGTRNVRFRVNDAHGYRVEIRYKLLGPEVN
ncbi:MAG TPA: cytochrome c oxidase accessory protein CcoG [Polyangiaceae bacterium]|jgi:cytochrome c oxidase accessory protein FixG|nr:cytochrome c oxidase accessory protein CcoG [Polyangiaceae bacterium]